MPYETETPESWAALAVTPGIAVVGLGGAGSEAVHDLVGLGIPGVRSLAVRPQPPRPAARSVPRTPRPPAPRSWRRVRAATSRCPLRGRRAIPRAAPYGGSEFATGSGDSLPPADIRPG